MIRDAASERQVQAADPGASTWLSANAGSGKTRVLTDRVARLLLAGCQPQRILCLTYTKAAASEMQNRLFRRLGAWAMLEEGALRAELDQLGVGGTQDAETLAAARRLFARAIETPGGLKIQTIHSFCASLLRRFPLEAGVSPQFTEMDDRTAELLRAEIIEEMADADDGVIAALARHYSGESFTDLAAECARHRAGFAAPHDLHAAFGLPEGMTAKRLLADVFLGGEAAWLAKAAPVLAQGKATDVKLAETLAALDLDAPDLGVLAALEGLFLFGEKTKAPFAAKIGSLPTKDTRAALGPLLAPLEDWMARVEAARPGRLALVAAMRGAVLQAFASRFLPEYERRKLLRGWLDFDDLILRARALLTDPSVAQWVLYRLDGGIDHILVDEAQDTSPDQWKVIELLAQEFTAGEGARGEGRTIFVVGDRKQSIYSFQGADLSTFEAMQAQFGTRLAAAQQGLNVLELEYSFRSSPAVLNVVDRTFGPEALGGAVRHLAFRSAMPGRVDVWPALPPADDPEPQDWFDPVDMPAPRHHTAELAETIAAEIGRMIAARAPVPAQGGGFRPVRAGDFLILVQRRSALFQQIIRACKARGLPIAGADRLRLGAEMAVRDLAALLSFLSLPEDDLSLAAILRSPLFGWGEAALHDLAHGRKGYLWAALRDRATDFADTHGVLTDLRDQADYLRPFELIDRMLTRHDGRRKLIARLGPEAEDGIDQFLQQALAYERVEIPSLTGFLGWLQTDDIEVKRQPDSAGNRIRVMTVHGAKGLEAPVVILPDTADRKLPEQGEIVTLADGTPIWRVASADMPPAMAEARAEAQARRAAENLRLLYVAMTRAESWLIVAAAGKLDKGEAWHDLIRAGAEAAGAVAQDFPTGAGLRLQHGDWPDTAAEVVAAAPPAPPPLPPWARSHAATPPRPMAALSPSDLGGAKALAGEGDPDALARGTALHRLLELLPGRAEAEWEPLARTLPGADAGLLAEAGAVLRDPALAALFAPDTLAEVPVVADLGGRRMMGAIDRLVVTPDRVLAVDFKSNRIVPPRPEDVPEGILRQMGAYAAALAQIYPGRRVETAVVWTAAPLLMPLPQDLVNAALRRAAVG
ncbi:double-strand break repair helicase AddA [Ruixingdingia sedimenti]|uniref:DNA 3'-5' helicase n=1 Tax=Ruixingdingia sedimenti TaxID=3073604 RepID=A0ABU1F727_9RHOB|nr:double-strand break repair helicase AddA [Xinfangfangia sp. LG-4]MDR5652680.1 double-strand break repair helicase AddA [Xinfangfangia sp. LG-4]